MPDLRYANLAVTLATNTRATIASEPSKTDEAAILIAALPVPYMVLGIVDDLPPAASTISSPSSPEASLEHQPVPEPSSLLVLAAALCGFSLIGRGVK